MGGSCQGSGRAEHPTRNLPRWCVARGVLGYREASRRGFPRSVASSTQVSSIRLDEGRPGSRPEGIFLLSDRAVTSLGQLRTNLWPLQFLGSETAAIRDQERMPYRPFVPEVLDNRTSRPSRHFSQGVSPTFERSFGVALQDRLLYLPWLSGVALAISLRPWPIEGPADVRFYRAVPEVQLRILPSPPRG